MLKYLSKPINRLSFLGPVAPLTECNKWSDDGHGQGSYEQVDSARQERDLPYAGVTQSNDISMSMMHLNVALNAGLRWEWATDLSGRTQGQMGMFMNIQTTKPSPMQHNQ